jgi:hypothetical protein
VPIEPSNAYILVVEDNIQNFVLIARLMAFLGVKQCQWKASGWQVLMMQEAQIRQNAGQPIWGSLCLLQRQGSKQ